MRLTRRVRLSALEARLAEIEPPEIPVCEMDTEDLVARVRQIIAEAGGSEAARQSLGMSSERWCEIEKVLDRRP
jgi:hypothetical protein